MRILLVDAPFHAFMHYDRWFYPAPLTQLAAMLYENNHDVKIYDGDRYFYKDPSTKHRVTLMQKQELFFKNIDNFNHRIYQHYLAVLKDFKPQIVGFTIYTCKLQSVLSFLKFTKKFDPKIITCVGGAHAIASAKQLIENENIDTVFCGYSDNAIVEWIDHDCPKGIITIDHRSVDVANLPFPRRDSLLFPEYFTPKDMGLLITSRGCIGRCTFCSNSFLWSGKPIYRKSNSIRNEINELLNKWNVQLITLGDSSNSDVPDESMRVAQILKEFNVPWTTNVRWATLTKSLIEYFMECGCVEISIGLETGTDKMLLKTKKGCNKSLIRKKAKEVNSLGINWKLFSIVGFPEETIEDMIETKKFIIELNPTMATVNSLSPLPGTDVYNSINKITPEISSSINQLHPNMSFAQNINVSEFKNIFSTITREIENHNKKNQ